MKNTKEGINSRIDQIAQALWSHTKKNLMKRSEENLQKPWDGAKRVISLRN